MEYYVKINTGLLTLPLVVNYLLTEESRVQFQLIGQDTFTSFLSIRVLTHLKAYNYISLFCFLMDIITFPLIGLLSV